ncbi:MAG: type II secretion system F family protein [Propionibacteriaceae bacterium]|nr:type II secretion system F family protein [Propionibacteriaceae bacterium]
MMSIVVGVIPGFVAALSVWLLALGVRMYRYNPLDDVDPESLIDSTPLALPGQAKPMSLVARLGSRLVPLIRTLLPGRLLQRLQRLIDLAGRPSGVSVDSVLGRQAGLLLIAIPIAMIYSLLGQGIVVVLIVFLFLIWPLIRLTTLARKRREQIDNDLPDFLDVLAVTVSAGVGFRSALGTVSSRFGGPLAEEVTTTLHQISNGASVRSAFRNMRRRTNSDSVNEFVTAYLQAEELGAPLVDSLNQIALDMRRSAAQRALQRAAGVAPRITLISTLVMVPGTLIIVMIGLFVGSGVDLFAVFNR